MQKKGVPYFLVSFSIDWPQVGPFSAFMTDWTDRCDQSNVSLQEIKLLDGRVTQRRFGEDPDSAVMLLPWWPIGVMLDRLHGDLGRHQRISWTSWTVRSLSFWASEEQDRISADGYLNFYRRRVNVPSRTSEEFLTGTSVWDQTAPMTGSEGWEGTGVDKWRSLPPGFFTTESLVTAGGQQQ